MRFTRAARTTAAQVAMAAVAIMGTCVGTTLGAPPVQASFPTPTLDRWMYPFNQANPAGSETETRIFSTLNSSFATVFDNRDGQMLVAWDTGPSVQSGLSVQNYRVISAVVTARISQDNRFVYNPGPLSYRSLLPTTDPQYVAPTTAGQPLEMFICGYRLGWTQQTFVESSPFRGLVNAPPGTGKRDRNVYPLGRNASGQLVDVSNNVDERFDPSPAARGVATTNSDQPNAVAPGALVPLNTDMTFTLNLSDLDVNAYLRQNLAAGRVSVLITSLTLTDQQASTTPRFYTKEFVQQVPDPSIKAARLDITVCVGNPADWDCNGQIEVADIFAFLSDWFAGRGDFNADAVNDVPDIFAFLSAWFAG